MAEAISPDDPPFGMGGPIRTVLAVPQPWWYEAWDAQTTRAVYSAVRGYSDEQRRALAQIALDAQAQGHAPEQVAEAIEKVAPGLLRSTGAPLTKDNLSRFLEIVNTTCNIGALSFAALAYVQSQHNCEPTDHNPPAIERPAPPQAAPQPLPDKLEAKKDPYI
jgi:hypothetical protein